MILTVKQLSQNQEIIAPQTVAEAVLVKNNDNVITLNTALSYKQDNIITPVSSGLKIIPQNNSVILTHTNSVEATDTLAPRLIKYDSTGHIIESAVEGTITIKINSETIIESGTQENQTINFGDDFRKDEQNNIGLNWKQL